MRETIELVEEFAQYTACPKANSPRVPSPETCLLRLQLLQEELAELAEAYMERNPVKVLDALTDLQYVLDGAYLVSGFDAETKRDAFREVHRSNMTKIDQTVGASAESRGGRVQKGPNYSPPRLEPILWEANERAKV